ncbi:MAG: chorismate mutase [Alphaproteobacteria bacterium]|jgi:chorismate mutase-like protein|nr:chorismate mutase [Alphaproteobacteria bacterium]MDP7223107.1 chorismate mutase [Alphaproteobacteria bacterium]
MKRPFDNLLSEYRDRIDQVDSEIIALLEKRVGIIREVAHIKAEHDIPSVIPVRVDEVRERAASMAADRDIDPQVIREIYARLIQYSCDLEDEIKNKLGAA